MPSRLHTLATAITLSLACAVAGEEPAPQPSGAARPLLKQLNEETQSLYREIQAGVVRVQLPPPKWAGLPLAEQDNPMNKWGDRLDPAVRQQLQQDQAEVRKGRYRRILASVAPAAATRPAAQTQKSQSATQSSVGSWSVSSPGEDVIILHPSGPGAGTLTLDAGGGLTADGQIVAGNGRLNVSAVPGGSFTPNNIGLLLDGDGYVLVPICVEKESIDAEGVRVMVGPGDVGVARFVGSDRQTNITLLKLEKPAGLPVKLAERRPQEGTLTMFLSPNSGVGRLMIWTNELKDWGVVAGMDGGVYGFTRQGQFLSAAACRPTIQQLIQTGAVRRAKIGVGIAEVPANDPAREADATLGSQPAVRVNEVAPNSAAAGAGVKVGDLILRCNDQPVGDPHSFAAAIGEPSAKTSLKLLRAGREETVTIEPPSPDAR
jgi:hypothetical protein